MYEHSRVEPLVKQYSVIFCLETVTEAAMIFNTSYNYTRLNWILWHRPFDKFEYSKKIHLTLKEQYQVEFSVK